MNRHPTPRRIQRAMTLVELMVALLIGMLTVLAVVQMMTTFGRQQRLGSSVNDIQNSALLALNTIEHDVLQAGHGLAHNELQNCTTFHTERNGSAIADFSTAAVSITDGGTGPDTLRVRYVESLRADAPIDLAADTTLDFHNLRVASSYGIQVSDLVLVSDGSRCSLRQVTAIDSGSSPQRLRVDATGDPRHNPTAQGSWPNYAAATPTRVHALGNLVQSVYAVDVAQRRLTRREFGATAGEPVAQDIVDLQAQYGITASATSATVTQWVDASAAPWIAPGPAERKRIKAVRIAVVAKSAEADGSDVSTAPIVLWPAVAAGAGQQSTARTYTPTGIDRRYRYRVLRMVYPLKNVMWAELT